MPSRAAALLQSRHRSRQYGRPVLRRSSLENCTFDPSGSTTCRHGKRPWNLELARSSFERDVSHVAKTIGRSALETVAGQVRPNLSPQFILTFQFSHELAGLLEICRCHGLVLRPSSKGNQRVLRPHAFMDRAPDWLRNHRVARARRVAIGAQVVAVRRFRHITRNAVHSVSLTRDSGRDPAGT